MPHDGAITFGDLVGKLGKLRVECAKCERSGTYRLARLIAKYGRNAKLFTWMDEITADCPRKLARDDSDPCGAICPDLPESALNQRRDRDRAARQQKEPRPGTGA